MDKLHTHYDNLKISRQAPQEVIRAAYKALSQKYHPDKNPGDEKAARIMAILNSAYGTLCDEQRRKEHDEWIAAEEWEIAWLESTQQDDPRTESGELQTVADGKTVAAYSRWRDPGWWLMMVFCLGFGWLAAIATQAFLIQPAPTWFAMPSYAMPAPEPVTPANVAVPKVDSKLAVVSHIRIQDMSDKCDGVLLLRAAQAALAPNGQAWPLESAYLPPYPLANTSDTSGQSALRVDNKLNNSAIYAQLFDLDKAETVRHVFVKEHQEFVIEKLTPARYELRYQDVNPTSVQERCNNAH
ncbi:MAG: J domain-containing protein [Pseudomonadota bacterium]